MVSDGDVAWTGAATRVAKNLGVAARADVKAIVDKANADTAALRNQVIGTQTASTSCATRARLSESAMGNLVADAMRAKYPGVPRRRSPTRAACARTSCSTAPPQRASSPARSPTARCSPCCRSATAR